MPTRAARRNTSISLPDVRRSNSIPRLLHQVYFPGWQVMPEELRHNAITLQERNRGWKYNLYNAAAAEKIISELYGPEILEVYLSIDPAYYAARADLLRYLICYAEGGVYLDLKSRALRPLDDVIQKTDVYLLSQWPERRHLPAGQSSAAELRHVEGCEYVQWFIAAAPGHPYLKAVIEAVLENITGYQVLRTGVGKVGVLRLTGPFAYTRAIHPIRHNHPHRYLDYDTELGFQFSLYGGHHVHREVLTEHYSRIASPIIKQGPVTTILTKVVFEKLQPAIQRNRKRLKRLISQ